jgi:hypothetical protein
MKMSTTRSSFVAAFFVAALGVAGAAQAQPAPPPRTGIQPASQDRVYNTVLDLLRKSGPTDMEAAAGGERLLASLTRNLPVNARLSPLECYLAGCWIEVQFEGTEEEIAKAAFTMNMRIGEERRTPLQSWRGPKGRTALLLTDDNRIIEGWFVFVRERAVSPATREKHQIKMVRGGR